MLGNAHHPKDTFTLFVEIKVMCLVSTIEVLYLISKRQERNPQKHQLHLNSYPLPDAYKRRHKLARISWNFWMLLHKLLRVWPLCFHRHRTCSYCAGSYAHWPSRAHHTRTHACTHAHADTHAHRLGETEHYYCCD